MRKAFGTASFRRLGLAASECSRRWTKRKFACLAACALLALLGRFVVWRASWDLGYALTAAGLVGGAGLVLPRPSPNRAVALDGEKGYWPQLDGLRFLAFALVLVHHLDPMPYGTVAVVVHDNGWMGVDLFFVISSFLFFFLFFREKKKFGRIRLGHFFMRRTLRIWPLYFAYLLFMLVLTAPLGDIPSLILRNERVRGDFLFCDNILTYLRQSYNYEVLYVRHLWTLSYEEQVYFVTPFFAWITLAAYEKNRARWVAALFVAIPALGIWLRKYVVLHGALHPSVWVMPPLRSETIFAGFLTAMFARSETFQRIPSLCYVGAAVAAFFYLFGGLGPVDLSPHSSSTVYVALATGFAALVLSVLKEGGVLARVLGSRPLAYLGKISFGLYVWHWYGMFFSETRLLPFVGILMRGCSGEAWWCAKFGCAFAATLAFSAASYRFLERPFLRLKERFTLVPNRPI